ncbi:MAG: lactonase family protein [Leadbetterella sp.]|nr:lactonase family protein [Leadbetterella sp.]
MRKLFYLWSAMAALSACTTPESGEEGYRILIGTYTGKGSEGIYYYRLDSAMKEPVQISSTKGVKNPSFLIVDGDKVYAVNEEEQGRVQGYTLDRETGTFTLLSEQETGGAHPCHVSAGSGLLFAGNYSGGNLAVFPLAGDGSIGERTQLIANTGSGPVTERQEKPHVHSVNISPDGKSLWVADLGTDEVLVFDIDSRGVKEKTRIRITPGAGPRHIAFHTTLPVVYVINELNNTVSVISTQDFSTVQVISTLPEGFEGKSFCADVHVSPDGRFLYGSNRYSDSIVSFAVDAKSGKLGLAGHTPAGGKVPRNFAISPDGKYVLVANQDSDNVVVFERDPGTGLLKNTGTEISVSMPVCVKFL